MVEQCFGAFLIVCQVVHARGNHAHGAGHQQIGPAALRTVPRHVGHFTVKSFCQPFREAFFRLPQIDIAEPDLLKAKLFSPATNITGEVLRVLGKLLG